MRINKDSEHAKATNVFNGKDGAPRVVAVIPLCADVSASSAVQSLNASLDINEEVPEAGWTRVNVDRFKQKVQYLIVKRDLLASLDACRVADFVVFILSGEEEVDQEGEIILKAVESQGISNCFTVVQDLDKVEPAKRRPQVVSSLKSYITHWLPTTERVFSLDNRQESSNLVRSLCTTTTKGVTWRDQRSYMFIEDIAWPGGKSAVSEDGTGEVVLTGVVRGQGLKADRLLQVGDWGDFQVDKIVAAPLEARKKGKDDAMAVDSDTTADDVLDRAGEDQDDLAELAPEETIMDDVTNYAASVAPSERKGVLLDDHHYFSDEEEDDAPKRPRRLPKGTSAYQAAWYLDDVSDSGSDLEDFDMEDADQEAHGSVRAEPADGIEGMDVDGRAMTEGAPSEYPQSEMFMDPAPEDEAAQIQAYRNSRKNEEEEDLEFPDEIELPPNVDARERLIRYRGLKSLRTSVWEKEEDKPYEPEEWARLLEISDYKRTATKFLREAWAGGVKPGMRVNVHIRGVPLSLQGSRPLAMFSLLRHEHKRTACNYSILLSSEYEGPIKAKTEIIAQCGPRRMVINPVSLISLYLNDPLFPLPILICNSSFPKPVTRPMTCTSSTGSFTQVGRQLHPSLAPSPGAMSPFSTSRAPHPLTMPRHPSNSSPRVPPFHLPPTASSPSASSSLATPTRSTSALSLCATCSSTIPTSGGSRACRYGHGGVAVVSSRRVLVRTVTSRRRSTARSTRWMRLRSVSTRGCGRGRRRCGSRR